MWSKSFEGFLKSWKYTRYKKKKKYHNFIFLFSTVSWRCLEKWRALDQLFPSLLQRTRERVHLKLSRFTPNDIFSQIAFKKLISVDNRSQCHVSIYKNYLIHPFVNFVELIYRSNKNCHDQFHNFKNTKIPTYKVANKLRLVNSI